MDCGLISQGSQPKRSRLSPMHLALCIGMARPLEKLVGDMGVPRRLAVTVRYLYASACPTEEMGGRSCFVGGKSSVTTVICQLHGIIGPLLASCRN